MVTRDRRVLEQLIKQWAQDHTADYIVADYSASNEGLEKTQGFFNWVIKENHAAINLFALADLMESFFESRRKERGSDGLLCSNCKQFYDFAEPNQPDGSLICYACRTNPYR